MKNITHIQNHIIRLIRRPQTRFLKFGICQVKGSTSFNLGLLQRTAVISNPVALMYADKQREFQIYLYFYPASLYKLTFGDTTDKGTRKRSY